MSLLGLGVLQVMRKVGWGCASTDAVWGILLQFPQLDLVTLRQYLFVDQEWLGLNLKSVHNKIWSKSLYMSMKIADALMALWHHLRIPHVQAGAPLLESSVPEWDEASHEDSSHKLGVWRNLSPQAERDSDLYSLYSIIIVAVFSSK